jgi:nicotinate-nucleotide--dimethylbenzimidazole phosphoribosyltransferase
MTKGPAMTAEQALKALENGVALAMSLAEAGYRILVTGEMGIGNTTTSSAVASVLLDLPVETVTGRGAGLSDEGLERKRMAIRKAIDVNKPDPSDAFDVLQKLGGFDLAGLAGLYIGAALCRVPILIDGLPSSVAALLAARLVPNCRIAMLPSHCSAEPVAQAILRELELKALIFADMKLGEGTGAVCMLPLLDATLAVYHGSAHFADTGIEQYKPLGGIGT